MPEPAFCELKLSYSMETAAALLARRCKQDARFLERFEAAPEQVLAECDIDLHARGMRVNLHENDAGNWHLVLPDLDARTDQMADDAGAPGGAQDAVAAAFIVSAAAAEGGRAERAQDGAQDRDLGAARRARQTARPSLAARARVPGARRARRTARG